MNPPCFILDDAIIDVRTQGEWEAGHIEGATLALNLASYPDTSIETASPADFTGCETCTIVVYCRKNDNWSPNGEDYSLNVSHGATFLCCRIRQPCLHSIEETG